MDQRQSWFDGIDAFLFDLGRVLLDFSHERMMDRMAAVVGVPPLHIKRTLFDDQLLHALECGRISDQAFFAQIRSLAETSFTDDDLRLAMADIFSPITETVALLPQLKRAGKRLILVSNTSAIHFEHEARQHPWLSGFDAHILSYQIGSMKPASAFYAAALAAAGAPAERCLFIDDIAENIAGAEAAGFQTHHFIDRRDFLRKFPELVSQA